MQLTFVEQKMRSIVQHYNSKKYWKRREIVIKNMKYPKLLKYYYLYYIKRCDAFNNASFGTHMGYGASFDAPPILPHGMYGIIVAHQASFGKECTIYHQVTVGGGKDGGVPTIGNHVTIGAGAKLFGNIHIGDNVLIGGGSVVTFDVPDNAVVRAAKGAVFEKRLSESDLVIEENS